MLLCLLLTCWLIFVGAERVARQSLKEDCFQEKVPKTRYRDFTTFLLARLILTQLSCGGEEVHVIFDNPARTKGTPKSIATINKEGCGDFVSSKKAKLSSEVEKAVEQAPGMQKGPRTVSKNKGSKKLVHHNSPIIPSLFHFLIFV